MHNILRPKFSFLSRLICVLLLISLYVFVFFSAFLLYQASGLGITAGAHRLWAHRAYKAKWPLRVILIIFNTMAFQVNYQK